jgi:ATP-dependent RNA helicase RhlE
VNCTCTVLVENADATERAALIHHEKKKKVEVEVLMNMELETNKPPVVVCVSDKLIEPEKDRQVVKF